MLTYQDFEAARAARKLSDFIMAAIADYKTTDDYQTALLGREYMQQRNRTIMQTRKWLTDVFGRHVPDIYSPNYRAASAFYKSNVIQISQHLLANGVNFTNEHTKELLGGARFDNKLVRIVRAALAEGRAYAFFDGGNFTIFYADSVVPLLDEETGGLRAVIRFWQVSSDKPLRVTLYEEAGYTEMRKPQNKDLVCLESFSFETPQPYRRVISQDAMGGTGEVVAYENYPALPVVVCYSNYDRVAEIVGKRENIDIYDLIKSGMANNIEEASFIYWEMTNAAGMSDLDMVKFKQRLTELHVAKTTGQTQLTAHTLTVPTEAREALLTRLERDIYTDAMTVDMNVIASGGITATAIKAAYKRLNDRVDELEYCVMDFIDKLLVLAGVEDVPTFTRSSITNDDEVTQMILSAAEYLDEETILSKLPFLSSDEVQLVLDRRAAEAVTRFNAPADSGDVGDIESEA